MKSFLDLLPTEEYAKKLELEDSLNKQRKKMLFSEASYEKIKVINIFYYHYLTFSLLYYIII